MAPPAPPPPHWSHEAPQVTFQRPPQVSVQPQPQPQPLSFVQQPSPQLPAPPVALVSGPVSQLSPLNFTFSPPSAAQPLPSLSGFDAMSSQRRPLEFQSNLLLSTKKNSSSSSSGHSHLGVRSFAQFEEDSQSQSQPQPQPEIQAIQASDSKSLDQIINTIASEDTTQFTHLGSDESLAGSHYPPPPVEQHQCQSNIFDSSAATDAQYANTSSSSQLPYASAPNPAPRPLTFADYSPVYVTAQLPHLVRSLLLLSPGNPLPVPRRCPTQAQTSPSSLPVDPSVPSPRAITCPCLTTASLSPNPLTTAPTLFQIPLSLRRHGPWARTYRTRPRGNETCELS
jgi:hypothetical protein